MSLSEDERRELERLRKYYRQSKTEEKSQETFKKAIMLRGLFSGIAFVWISYYFKLNTLLGGNITLFGAFVCIVLGTLSSYYGPLKKKREAEG